MSVVRIAYKILKISSIKKNIFFTKKIYKVKKIVSITLITTSTFAVASVIVGNAHSVTGTNYRAANILASFDAKSFQTKCYEAIKFK